MTDGPRSRPPDKEERRPGQEAASLESVGKVNSNDNATNGAELPPEKVLKTLPPTPGPRWRSHVRKVYPKLFPDGELVEAGSKMRLGSIEIDLKSKPGQWRDTASGKDGDRLRDLALAAGLDGEALSAQCNEMMRESLAAEKAAMFAALPVPLPDREEFEWWLADHAAEVFPALLPEGHLSEEGAVWCADPLKIQLTGKKRGWSYNSELPRGAAQTGNPLKTLDWATASYWPWSFGSVAHLVKALQNHEASAAPTQPNGHDRSHAVVVPPNAAAARASGIGKNTEQEAPRAKHLPDHGERETKPELGAPQTVHETVNQLLAVAKALSPGDNADSIQQINAVVRSLAIANFGQLVDEQVLVAIKKQTGVGIRELRQCLRDRRDELTRPKLDDNSRSLNIGSDVEIAERVAQDLRAEFGEIVFDEGEFWHYAGTHWAPIDQQSSVRRAVHRYDGATYPKASGTLVAVQLSKAHIDSVLNEMGAMLLERDFFAKAPAGINCASGFIEFDTRGQPNLKPHDPQHRCRHVLSGRWQPGMDGENPPPDSLLGRLLDGVFKGDPDAGEKHKLLAEVAGAAAVGYGPKLRDPKAIVEVGETAGNGKSAVLDALRGLLPKTAVASISANKFGDEKYVVRLIGKLLNATDELSSAGAIASEIFKTVITGQPVEGRELYRSVVEFRPVAQHIFATNRLPKFTDGMDRGVKRRLLPLTFNRVIPTEERIENIGLRIADEEADLVLAFAVAGAQRLIRQRDFTIPASSKEALQQWIYRDNPVLAWVEVRVEAADPPRPGEKVVGIKSSMAHAMFRDWALAEGFAERGLPDVTGFVQRLKENQRVPGIKVRHTNSGNFLVGLKILAQDRDPAAEGIDEMRRPGGVNLNKGEGWPGRI